MKTKFTIFATILTLHISLLFAGNDITMKSTPAEKISNLTTLLAPVTPKEATFEELTAVPDLTSLAPMAPREATFTDGPDESAANRLAPVTPLTADFEDKTGTVLQDASIAPVIPAVAEFE